MLFVGLAIGIVVAAVLARKVTKARELIVGA